MREGLQFARPSIAFARISQPQDVSVVFASGKKRSSCTSPWEASDKWPSQGPCSVLCAVAREEYLS